MEVRLSQLRSEYEDESQESMRRAVHQLQVADDLVVGLRRKAAQEAEAHAACLRELKAVRREAEQAAASRVESSVLSKSSEQMNEIHRERQEALHIICFFLPCFTMFEIAGGLPAPFF